MIKQDTTLLLVSTLDRPEHLHLAFVDLARPSRIAAIHYNPDLITTPQSPHELAITVMSPFLVILICILIFIIHPVPNDRMVFELTLSVQVLLKQDGLANPYEFISSRRGCLYRWGCLPALCFSNRLFLPSFFFYRCWLRWRRRHHH